MTNLYGNGRFDLYCEEAAWAGAGRYEATNDLITLDFEVLSRRGEVVRRPVPLELTYVGKGNELQIQKERFKTSWFRRR